jgi:hypothetical protein
MQPNTLFLLFIINFLLFVPSHSLPQRFKSACTGKKIQVLSDVDDTMKAAGTNFVAGCDTRWPGSSIYAGLAAFYLELSRGPEEDNSPIGIGIVSARPEQLAAAFPDLEYEFATAAALIGVDAQIWGKIRVTLPGKFEDNAHIHTIKRFRDYGQTKIDNVKRFTADKKNQDYCVIFIGDNGQGDQYAGDVMLKHNKAVAAVFIHNVTASPLLPTEPNENLFMFKTYPEAAYIAYKQGFINKEAVHRVIENTLLSLQYSQCVACADVTQPCVLEQTVPQWNKVGGGCSELFYSIARVAQKIDYAHELPSLKVARVPLPTFTVVGFLISYLWQWVLFIILGVAIAFFFSRQLDKTKKTN